jgi:hypothetical protein
VSTRLLELAGVALFEGGLLGKADGFRLEIDRDKMVHLIDGEGTVRVSMPKDVWKELAIKTAKSLGATFSDY